MLYRTSLEHLIEWNKINQDSKVFYYYRVSYGHALSRPKMSEYV